jgi:hypothetical protein
MKVYERRFSESTLFIDDNNQIQLSSETLTTGIKTSFGKGKLIPYKSNFVFKNYNVEVDSLFQIQDKKGILLNL